MFYLPIEAECVTHVSGTLPWRHPCESYPSTKRGPIFHSLRDSGSIPGPHLHVRIKEHLDVIPRRLNDFQTRSDTAPAGRRIAGESPSPACATKKCDSS